MCNSERQPLPGTAEDASNRAPATWEAGQKRSLLSWQDSVSGATLGVHTTSGTPTRAACPG